MAHLHFFSISLLHLNSFLTFLNLARGEADSAAVPSVPQRAARLREERQLPPIPSHQTCPRPFFTIYAYI